MRVGWKAWMGIVVWFGTGLGFVILPGCPAGAPQAEVALEGKRDGSSEAASEKGSEGAKPEGSAENKPEGFERPPESRPDVLVETQAEKPAEIPSEMAPESVACQAAPISGPGEIQTTLGSLRGLKEGKTFVYRGIPYAAPPVGGLRWKPPQEAACWAGLRDAKAFGEVCPQRESKTQALLGSEDCLTLNVWTPETAQAQNLRPVMVFIHGGGNIQGSSREEIAPGKAIYDGRRLAEAGDVVVVTLNYRLGALGYLAFEELSNESPQGISGNYGIHDLIFALRWLQANLSRFGGDPKKVMLFGESAGAVNTCILVTSPQTKGLFYAALMQSGGCFAPTLAEARAGGQTLVEASSCKGASDRLACLRGLTRDAILTEFPGEIGVTLLKFGYNPKAFGPVVDGVLLPLSPLEAFATKAYPPVALVFGSNADEYESLLALPVPTKAAYEAYVRQIFPAAKEADIQAILALYPADQYPSPREALVDLLTDVVFTCPTRLTTRAVATASPGSVWRYFFSRRAKTARGETKAAHAIELVYVFQTLLDIPLFTPAAEDLALSAQIMEYWSSLAKAAVPTGSVGSLAWPPYDPSKETTLQLDAPLQILQGVRSSKCDRLEPLTFKP